jgi:isopenicillin N synthase-like dioxygenase
VNTGALLARWTNDTWRATAHRVIVPSAAVAAAERFSIACFIDPDAQAPVTVDDRFVPPGEAPRYGPTTGLEFLLMKLREAQGL